MIGKVLITPLHFNYTAKNGKLPCDFMARKSMKMQRRFAESH